MFGVDVGVDGHFGLMDVNLAWTGSSTTSTTMAGDAADEVPDMTATTRNMENVSADDHSEQGGHG